MDRQENKRRRVLQIWEWRRELWDWEWRRGLWDWLSSGGAQGAIVHNDVWSLNFSNS